MSALHLEYAIDDSCPSCQRKKKEEANIRETNETVLTIDIHERKHEKKRMKKKEKISSVRSRNSNEDKKNRARNDNEKKKMMTENETKSYCENKSTKINANGGT